NTASGAYLQILKNYKNKIYFIVFLFNFKLLISASGNKTVKLWDAASGVCLQTLEGYRDLVT
ncbi:hypothetical protein BP00DRAFT_318483, partial [Aspergillus indologenus CBS 114.80]